MKTHRYDSFARLGEDSRALLAAEGQRCFFHGLAWFENLAENGLEADARLAIACLTTDDDEAQAVLVAREPGGQHGSIFRGRRPPGRSYASLTSHQTVSFGIATHEHGNADFIRRSIALMAGQLGPCSVIDLNFFLADDMAKAVALGLADAGRATRRYVYARNLYESVDGLSYGEYLKSRPSLVRQTYARKRRKLDRSSSVELRILRSPDEMAPGVELYESVLDRSWKEPEPFPDFSAGLLHTAAREGVLRLGILMVDGLAVAAQVWIVSNGRATILKTHYDSAYQKQSAGAVLMLHMFEHMIDVEHVREVDYGVGAEPHKRHWLAHTRPINGVLGFDKTGPAGLAALARYDAGRALDRVRGRVAPHVKALVARLRGSNDT